MAERPSSITIPVWIVPKRDGGVAPYRPEPRVSRSTRYQQGFFIGSWGLVPMCARTGGPSKAHAVEVLRRSMLPTSFRSCGGLSKSLAVVAWLFTVQQCLVTCLQKQEPPNRSSAVGLDIGLALRSSEVLYRKAPTYLTPANKELRMLRNPSREASWCDEITALLSRYVPQLCAENRRLASSLTRPLLHGDFHASGWPPYRQCGMRPGPPNNTTKQKDQSWPFCCYQYSNFQKF